MKKEFSEIMIEADMESVKPSGSKRKAPRAVRTSRSETDRSNEVIIQVTPTVSDLQTKYQRNTNPAPGSIATAPTYFYQSWLGFQQGVPPMIQPQQVIHGLYTICGSPMMSEPNVIFCMQGKTQPQNTFIGIKT